MRASPRRSLRITLGLALALAIALAAVWIVMLRMPGRSHQGPLPPLDDAGRALARDLEAHVKRLAIDIGERNVGNPDRLVRARDLVEDAFRSAGLEPERQDYRTGDVLCSNVIATVAGSEPESVVVGAHYDSAPGTPGADDNASGTAALLALARRFAKERPKRTLRFVAFVNEEPPHFQTASMGSLVYARSLAERKEKVVAMLSLESIGYFRDEEGSQKYPPPLSLFYPSRGDFIAFVGNVRSRSLVRRAVRTFREAEPFPCEGAALVSALPGVGWSDQWAFWQVGYPALMVTDTAPFRNPHYHEPTDLPPTVNAERMARVTRGVEAVIRQLAH